MISENKKDNLILVVGMHRSGTSLLGSILKEIITFPGNDRGIYIIQRLR